MIAGIRPEARLIDTEPTIAVLMVAEEREERRPFSAWAPGPDAAQQAMLRSVWTRVLRAARGLVLVCPRGRRTEG